jgi:Tfp pilus assembly protein PilF
VYCYPFLNTWCPKKGRVVNRVPTCIYRPRPLLLALLIVITSCSGPKIDPERYQTASIASERSSGPVAELHRKAISAINQNSYPQAVEFLQRAINIEPRNAFSWHYLAQTYWHSKQYGRCIEMVNRSISYSTSQDDLDRANATLLSQCRAS